MGVWRREGVICEERLPLNGPNRLLPPQECTARSATRSSAAAAGGQAGEQHHDKDGRPDQHGGTSLAFVFAECFSAVASHHDSPRRRPASRGGGGAPCSPSMLLRAALVAACVASVEGYRQNLNVSRVCRITIRCEEHTPPGPSHADFRSFLWVQISMNMRQRMYRVVPLFGLDQGGYVRMEVEVARAALPRAPPPAWANIYLAFFNVHQWYEYDLPNFGNGVDPPYPCQTEDTHQCVQLCSLPSVRRFQVWGNPHKREQQLGRQTFEFNVTQRSEYTVVLLTCASIVHDEFVNVSVRATSCCFCGCRSSLACAVLHGSWSLLQALIFVGSKRASLSCVGL